MAVDPLLLPDWQGKLARVTALSDDPGHANQVVLEGRIVVASQEGVVIQVRHNSYLIPTNRIISIESAENSRPKKLVQRELRVLPGSEVRQHLVDRHGYPLDLVRIQSVADVVNMHSMLDHNLLGHVHGSKKVNVAALVEEKFDSDGSPLPPECDSCGRRDYADNYRVCSYDDGTEISELIHCEDCVDEEEFDYLEV